MRMFSLQAKFLLPEPINLSDTQETQVTFLWLESLILSQLVPWLQVLA